MSPILTVMLAAGAVPSDSVTKRSVSATRVWAAFAKTLDVMTAVPVANTVGVSKIIAISYTPAGISIIKFSSVLIAATELVMT